MRIDHLKYLVEVSETGSISQAAERLYISQQGLSQAIRQLERTLGVTLLSRTGNRIYLTDIGLKVVTKAKELLVKYDDLIDIVNDSIFQTSQNNTEDLVVLATPLLSLTTLSEMLNLYCEKRPHINLIIRELLPEEMLAEFKENDEAIGLFSIPDFELKAINFRRHKLKFQLLYESEAIVAVGKNSPLSKRSSFKLKDIIEHPIAIYDSGKNYEITKHILEPVGKPNIYLKTSNLKLYQDSIANGLAIGISTSFLKIENNKDSIIFIPLEDGYKFYVGLLYSNEKPLNSVKIDFINEIKNHIKNY